MDKYVIELEERRNAVEREIRDTKRDLNELDGTDMEHEDYLLRVLAIQLSVLTDIEHNIEEEYDWNPEEPQQYEDY